MLSHNQREEHASTSRDDDALGFEDGEDLSSSGDDAEGMDKSAGKRKRTAHVSPENQKQGYRSDNSLGALTKQFVQLVQTAGPEMLDRNKAAAALKVPKRRIYDVTNVLEGVGILEKTAKNQVQWASASSEDQQQKLQQVNAEIEALKGLERQVEDHVHALRASLLRLCTVPDNKRRLYLTDAAIRSLPCFQSDTVLALRAPTEYTLELGSTQGGQYTLAACSNTSSIDVFLVHAAEHIDVTATENPEPRTSSGPASPEGRLHTPHLDEQAAMQDDGHGYQHLPAAHIQPPEGRSQVVYSVHQGQAMDAAGGTAPVHIAQYMQYPGCASTAAQQQQQYLELPRMPGAALKAGAAQPSGGYMLMDMSQLVEGSQHYPAGYGGGGRASDMQGRHVTEGWEEVPAWLPAQDRPEVVGSSGAGAIAGRSANGSSLLNRLAGMNTSSARPRAPLGVLGALSAAAAAATAGGRQQLFSASMQGY